MDSRGCTSARIDERTNSAFDNVRPDRGRTPAIIGRPRGWLNSFPVLTSLMRVHPYAAAVRPKAEQNPRHQIFRDYFASSKIRRCLVRLWVDSEMRGQHFPGLRPFQ